MKITMLTIWRSLTVGLLVMAFSDGVFAGTEFSAEMLQHGPQGQVSTGKLFVGDKRVRTEMSQQGRQIIQIADENQGIARILLPDQKKYMEHQLGGSGTGRSLGAKVKRAKDPCDSGTSGLTCRRLGEAAISGRTTIKWEMVASHQGQTMKSTHWIDKERGVPLRQEMPDGRTTELKLVAMENLDGRQVEKWEMVMTIPNQPETRTFRWFDPELELDIREELPGGMVSELKNIRIGKQPDELFNVPAGYERVTDPQGAKGVPAPGG